MIAPARPVTGRWAVVLALAVLGVATYGGLLQQAAAQPAQPHGSLAPGVAVPQGADASYVLTEQELYAALQGATGTQPVSIVLAGNIRCTSVVWETPVEVSGSVTISAVAGLRPVLDFGMLYRKILLQPNATVLIQNIAIVSARRGVQLAMPGVEVVYAPKPWASFTMRRTTYVSSICFDHIPRDSPAFAGMDAEIQLLEPATYSMCMRNWEGRKTCPLSKGWNITDMAVYALQRNSTTQSLSPAGYTMSMLDSDYGCFAFVTLACVRDYGVETCAEMEEQKLARNPPKLDFFAPLPEDSGESKGEVIGVVVGSVVGGLLLAALVVALVIWRCRKYGRCSQRAQNGGTKAGLCSVSSGGKDGTRRTDLSVHESAVGSAAQVSSIDVVVKVPTGPLPSSSSGVAGSGGTAAWGETHMRPTSHVRDSQASNATGTLGVLLPMEQQPMDPSHRSQRPTSTHLLTQQAAVIPPRSLQGSAGSHMGSTFGTFSDARPEPTSSQQPSSSGGGVSIGRHKRSSLAFCLGATTDPALAATEAPDVTAQPPRPPMSLAIGREVQLFNDPTKDPGLGMGIFGKVVDGSYQGWRVAVKLLHPAVVQTMEVGMDLQALEHEVDILSRCCHRNVVRLLGASLSQPQPFLVLERMQCSLSHLLYESAAELPLDKCVAIARDIAAGLAYLHPNIVHRDLKPSNVLLDDCGVAKLADFGLARLSVTTLVTDHPEAGTAPYLAPECFGALDTGTSIKVTDKVDMWAFGVILWEMIMRKQPWAGLTALQVGVNVLVKKEKLPLPASTSSAFPPRLAKLISACWEHDPVCRPSAAEAGKLLTLLLKESQLSKSGAALSEEGSLELDIDLDYEGTEPAGAGMGVTLGLSVVGAQPMPDSFTLPMHQQPVRPYRILNQAAGPPSSGDPQLLHTPAAADPSAAAANVQRVS